MPRVWVRYEMPVMVLVELSEDQEVEEIRKVVIADDREEIQLARDHRGHFIVYSRELYREGEGPAGNEPDQLATDSWPGMRAITVTEHQEWPGQLEWEHGPDPLRWPGLYDDDDQVDAEDEESEPEAAR